MKKVAILKRYLHKLGGLEKQTHRLAEAFAERGCAVTLISHDQAQSFETRPLASFDRKSLSAFDITLGIDRLPYQTHIRAGNGVHAAYLKTKGWIEKLLPKHRKELSVEKKALQDLALRHIITNSEMVKQQYIEHYGIDEKKITAIHNGVEWQGLKDIYLKRLKRPEGPFHFLFVGNDLKRKGLTPLLHALSYLEGWKLTVVGADKRLKAYKTLSHGLGIQNHVEFAGKVANVTDYYSQADCFVLPSFYDPFANVTVEALACGLPVITTPTNGGSEVLTPETGNIVTDTLSLALEEAMHTKWDAKTCRASVEHLDFSKQLQTFVDVCLST